MNSKEAEPSDARAAAVRHALDLLGQGRATDAERALASLTTSPWGSGPGDARQRALALDGLGRARFALGDVRGALVALRTAVEVLKSACAAISVPAGSSNGDNAPPDLRPLLCRALQNLCFALAETGAVEESATVGHEAGSLAEALFGPRSPELAGALLRFSSALYRACDFAGAEALILRARAIWEAQPGPTPQEVGTCLNNLGRIREELGDMTAGIAFHRQAVAFRRTLPDRDNLAFSLGNLGVALAEDGQWQAACDALEEALELYAALGKGEGAEARGYAANLAVCRDALHAEAEGN